MKPNKLHRLEEAAKALPPKRPNLKDQGEVTQYLGKRFFAGTLTESDFDLFWSAFGAGYIEVIHETARKWFWARQEPDWYWTGPCGNGWDLAAAILSSTPEHPVNPRWFTVLESASNAGLHGEPIAFTEHWGRTSRGWVLWGHIGARVLGPDRGEVLREVLQEQWRAEGPPPPTEREPECECGGWTCRSCEDKILEDPLWDIFELKKNIIRQRAAEAAREALGRPKPEQ